MALAARPRREELYAVLLEQVLRGELPPGSWVNASQLARRLGASRTPVHEALLRLAGEGFVQQEINRGFVVAPLTRDEVRQHYPIVWTLEALALRSSGTLVTLLGAELQAINRALAQAASAPERAQQYDLAFHTLLVSRCDNARLHELLAVERRFIARYERIYMRRAELIAHSVTQHEQIVAAIDAADLAGATVALERNWRFGMEAVLLQVQESR